MLAARGVPSLAVGREGAGIDTQLAGQGGHDLRMGVLANAQGATRKARVVELDGEAELGRGPPPAADHAEVSVRQCVVAPQGAVIELGRQLGERGALGGGQELAGRHG